MCNMWQQIYTRIYKHSLWNTKGSSSDGDLENAPMYLVTDYGFITISNGHPMKT